MKKLSSSVLILASLLVMPVIGLAQELTTTAPDVDVWASLANITNWLFAILIVIAVLFLIVAALQYVTAQGDPEKIKSANSKVLYALLGVVVGILARGLVSFIETIVRP